MKQNAFFYDGDYYLYPEDCKSPQQLLEKHGGGKSFAVRLLAEKMSMPPYFISEHIKGKRLRLTKNAAVFPCEVEILTMAEYNARLRQLVRAHCPGCSQFGGVDETDTSLKGHHKELTLDDLCFLREGWENTGDWAYLNLAVDLKRFVRAFGRRGFEEPVEQGRFNEASKAFYDFFGEEICEPTFPVFFTKAPDGRCALYFSLLTCKQDVSLLSQLCGMLNRKYEKTWVFHSFLPKGYTDPQALKPKGMLFTPPDENQDAVLTVYAEPGRIFDAWLWLCGQFGENRMCGCLNIDIQPAPDKPKRGPSLAAGIKAVEKYLYTQDELLRVSGIEDVENRVIPIMRTYFTKDLPPDADEVTLLNNSLSIVSFNKYLTNMFAIPLCDGKNPLNVWNEDCLVGETGRPIACLEFEFEAFPNAGNTLIEKLINEDLLAIICQQAEPGKNRFCVWGVVPDYSQLKYELRRWTPAFQNTPVTLSVYTASHKEGGRYRIDWNMTRLQSEEEMGIEYTEPEAETEE